MRPGLVILLMLLGCSSSEAGSLEGMVVNPDGEPVYHAPVRVSGVDGDSDYRTYTDRDGRFVAPRIAPGNYVVEVVMPCCRYQPYRGTPQTVGAADVESVTVELAPTDYLIALSDDPGQLAHELIARRALPDRVVGRVSDRPDFSGMWVLEDDPFAEDPSPTDEARKVVEARDPDDLSQDLFALCLPGELPIPGASTPILSRFVHTPDLLVMLFEGPPGFRQVFLDGRALPEHPNPAWLGHSVGRWEGDTLVVESTGFDVRGRIGDYPRSEKMRLTERYTRTEYGMLELEIVVDDVGSLTEPWIRQMHFDLVPQEPLIEFVCENNVWVQAGE